MGPTGGDAGIIVIGIGALDFEVEMYGFAGAIEGAIGQLRRESAAAESGLQQKRSDMSKKRFENCIVSEDTRIIWNGRSAQASVRSANRTTSSSSTVASARLSVLDTSALSRTLERAERRRTQVGRAPSVKRDPPYHDLWNAVAAPLVSVVLSENRSSVGRPRAEPRRVRRFH